MDTASKHYATMSRDELLAQILAAEAAFGGRRRLDDLAQDLRVQQEELAVQQGQLREAQRALEESRDRYADLFDFAPIPFLTVDRIGVIQEANLAAAALLGAHRDRLPGFPFMVYVGERDRRDFLDHLSRCRQSEEAVVTRLQLRRRGESERLVELVSRHAVSAAGVREVWHTGLIDVTASAQAESDRRTMEIERLRMQHEEQIMRTASETKDRFLAVLSHELRTPLTPILLKLGALEARGAVPEELREPLALVRRNIEVEARLIDDLLDTTRIVHGKLHVEQTCVDVHEQLTSLLDASAGGLSADHEIQLILSASAHHVRGDALRLRQVFWNLLSNAQHHTPVGGTITVTTSNPKPECLRISIADNGSGIAPELLERIFEPFEQAEGTTRRGLGLGLAISKGIVEAHHGWIRARSDGPGQGATLEVELDTIANAAEQTMTQHTNGDGAQVGLRILLVEDHPDSAESLSELLGMFGHQVTIASCFAEAAARREQTFDLLITDIGLPDGNGLDLRRVIVHDARTRSIALSGYGSAEDVERSRKAGFDRHLTKPVTLDDLLRAVDDVTHGGRAVAAGASAGVAVFWLP